MGKTIAFIIVFLIGIITVGFLNSDPALYQNLNVDQERSLNETYPPWITQAAEFENLTVEPDGTLRINKSCCNTGVYESQVFQTSELQTVDWETITYSAEVADHNLTLVFGTTNKLGNGNFNTTEFELLDGENTINLEEKVESSKYAVFELRFEEDLNISQGGGSGGVL